ncbi:hypothetical protein [Streptomyces hiroshimensis]|uniref:Uncharacterized protein n=1 Tax=Streptomyces hiroshimensis TaxID=66424 RepID=A0ABQ2Z8C8_9ACTN|nr:hypothetical protein [Streptomyces hiroshimensis]GGY05015.1 hypothetical protein GCM10010324_59700 [Streptomyces hiroshimensis]
MTDTVPRTIRAVSTERLLLLEQEAATLDFSQRLPVEWVREHAAPAATHYLFPLFVHELRHRPEVSPQWRCELLLTVVTGEEIRSMLDVRPDSFQALPESLTPAAKRDIARRIERTRTQREYCEGTE